MYSAKNELVISQISENDNLILDVGCGTGENANVIKKLFPGSRITGINHSMDELAVARSKLDHGILFDLNGVEEFYVEEQYDLIVFSHVLEHLIDPIHAIQSCSKFLKENGRVILVVPNLAIWTSRLKLLSGKFNYEEHGLFDRTHLRFYTWFSLPRELVPTGFKIDKKLASGHLPLPLIRKLLPIKLIQRIDRFAVNRFPNLFAWEVGLIISKKKSISG